MYKDFNKDVKDLLTKNYMDAGKWKVEAKFKAGKDTLYVNPQAAMNKAGTDLTVDVHYNLGCCPVKTKTKVTPDGGVKPTITYEKDGHKVEVSATKAINDYEISYEGKFGNFAVHDKLTKNVAEGFVSTVVAPHCQAGGGISYNIGSGALSWTIGARYSNAGYLYNLVVKDLKTFVTGVGAPVTVAGQKVKVAAQFDCAHKSFKWVAGLELNCPMFPKNAARVRVNQDLKAAVAYIVPLTERVKAAISVNADMKPGVHFTLE